VQNSGLLREGELPDLIADPRDEVWEEVEFFQE
jgi:hypothetical protein